MMKVHTIKGRAGWPPGQLYSRNLMVLSLAFLAVNAVIYLLAVPGGALKFGADSSDYYIPAQALYEHGYYHLTGEQSILKTYRTPGYSLFLAAAMLPSDGSPIDLVIGLQIAMLLLTGLAARSMTENHLPGYGDAVFGLVIFNPNALISSQLIQTDTLMSMLFVMSIVTMDRYLTRRNLWLVALCGFSLGLACLVRPTPLYLIAILPIAFPLAMALAGDGGGWRRHVGAGVLASTAAIIVLLPWLHYMAGQGEGYTIGSARVKFVFAMDNILILEQHQSGAGQIRGGDILRQREAAYLETLGEDSKKLSNVERHNLLASFHINNLTKFPVVTLMKGALIGMGNMFVGGSAVSYHRLLGLEHKSGAVISAEEDGSNYFLGFLKSLSYASPMAVSISVIAIGFAAVMRILGLLGLIVLIARKHWPLLLVISAVVSYFGLVHIFNSSARYRMPIETPLLILAMFGFDSLRKLHKQLSN
jgi:hypothetical protein